MIDVKAIGKGLIEKINAVQESSDERVCGRIVYSGDGVVRISGLNDARYNELLQVHGGYYALALNLEEKEVGAVLFSGEDKVRYGDLVYSTGQTVQMPVGEAMLGRIVDPLGKPIDGLDAIDRDDILTREPELLKGEVSSPVNPVNYCRFYTRCRYACEKCREHEYELKQVSENHYSACVLEQTGEIGNE